MSGTDTSGFAAAQQAAASADATVIVIGLDQTQESEGHDRTAINLPGVQDEFVQAVASSSKVSPPSYNFTIEPLIHRIHCRALWLW